MSEWEIKTLDEITTKIGSGATPRGGKEAYKKNGINLIRSQNVLDFKFSYSGLAFIDEAQAEKLKNVTIEKDDVLINITGDSVARVCQVTKNEIPARVNQHVSIVRANKLLCNSRFLKYTLLTPYNKKSLLMIASDGGTRNAITKSDLENFEIALPPLQEQKQIAHILSTLDAKIDLLRRQNETLENMAQALFKRWFVDFEFPDDNGNPYKSSGGKMIPSELGLIPEGWNVGKLQEFIDYKIDNRGKSPSVQNEGFPLVEVNSIINLGRVIELNKVKKFVNSDTYENWFRNGHPISGDSLVSTVGSIGNIAKVGDLNICIAQNIVAFRNNTYPNYLYHTLNSLKKEIMSLDISSVQPSVKVPHLLQLIIVIPNQSFLNQFEEVCNPIDSKIHSNSDEIQTLTKTRDTLLPKLMSGQVRVKDLEVA